MKRHMAIWAMQCLGNARHQRSIIRKIKWLGVSLMVN
jgi:hypothetical protein